MQRKAEIVAFRRVGNLNFGAFAIWTLTSKLKKQFYSYIFLFELARQFLHLPGGAGER